MVFAGALSRPEAERQIDAHRAQLRHELTGQINAERAARATVEERLADAQAQLDRLRLDCGADAAAIRYWQTTARHTAERYTAYRREATTRLQAVKPDAAPPKEPQLSAHEMIDVALNAPALGAGPALAWAALHAEK